MASTVAPTGRTGSHMPLLGGGCTFLYSYAPTRQVCTAVGPRCHPEIRRQRHTMLQFFQVSSFVSVYDVSDDIIRHLPVTCKPDVQKGYCKICDTRTRNIGI
jgi:hypothetical protein